MLSKKEMWIVNNFNSLQSRYEYTVDMLLNLMRKAHTKDDLMNIYTNYSNTLGDSVLIAMSLFMKG